MFFENARLIRIFSQMFYIPLFIFVLPMLCQLCVLFPNRYGRLYWRAVLDIILTSLALVWVGIDCYFRIWPLLYHKFQNAYAADFADFADFDENV